MFNSPSKTMVPGPFPDPLTAAHEVAAAAYALAAERDADASAPEIEISLLGATGLLHAPLPVGLGGIALGMTASTTLLLRDVLRIIGGGSLALGRLYEGHVNAVRLVTRYGSPHQCVSLTHEADAGRLSAVWNAQTGPGLRLEGVLLAGGKIHTSGAGLVRRPLLTAMQADSLVMLLPDVAGARISLAEWTPLGMRASLTGSADFTGLSVSPDDIVGQPGDYYRSPHFAGGAWRVLAVQLGGLERLMALYRAQLADRGRRDDPLQRARFGEAAANLETARLWTARTARIAEDPSCDAGEVDTLVNLARHAFERAALAIIEAAERGIGLSAMLRPNPIERIVRDLTTYLRQPFPDAALAAAAGWALEARPLHIDMGTS